MSVARYVGRDLLTTARLACLAAPILVLITWVCSHFAPPLFPRSTFIERVRITAFDGRLWLETPQREGDRPRRMLHQTRVSVANLGSPPFYDGEFARQQRRVAQLPPYPTYMNAPLLTAPPAHLGNGFGFFHEMASVQRGGSWWVRYDVFAIPCYAALALAAMPACLLLRHRLRGRNCLGHCSNCGYDLRASPVRCPECGTPRSPLVVVAARRGMASASHRPKHSLPHAAKEPAPCATS